MSVELAVDFNLYQDTLTMLGSNRRKITENPLADIEVPSVKLIFLSEKKEFLRNLFVTL